MKNNSFFILHHFNKRSFVIKPSYSPDQSSSTPCFAVSAYSTMRGLEQQNLDLNYVLLRLILSCLDVVHAFSPIFTLSPCRYNLSGTNRF